MRAYAWAGEHWRKAVCVRKSDHLEVSDQRCERLPRPVATAEPCNTNCEIRFASALNSTMNVRHATFAKKLTSVWLSSGIGGTLPVKASAQLNAGRASAAWTCSA